MTLPPDVIATDAALSNRRSRSTVDDTPLTEAELAELAEWQAENRVIQKRIIDMKEKDFERSQTAVRMLHGWAKAHRQRDEVIRAAHAAGLSVRRIQRITGVARTTIVRILEG